MKIETVWDGKYKADELFYTDYIDGISPCYYRDDEPVKFYVAVSEFDECYQFTIPEPPGTPETGFTDK